MTIELVAVLIGIGIWAAVVIRAWRQREELVVLALVLVVLGILGAQLLEQVGIRAPGSWSFALVGALLMLLWPPRERRA